MEHFQALLREAVADRLRCDRAGVWMSGGMDSSTVAATARGLSGTPTEIRAYTMVYDSLIPDIERNHAQQVADFLGYSHTLLGNGRISHFSAAWIIRP